MDLSKLSQLSNMANTMQGPAAAANDCTNEANEARLSMFKSAGKEIAKTLCSGLYTTTDPATGKNLKQVMMDRISDVVFEVANTPDTIRTIRKAITVPLEKYSKQLFEVATADTDRINSFTANVLQNLFNKTDPLIPKILKYVFTNLTEEERVPDIVMNAMAERILQLLSQGNKIKNEAANVNRENIQPKDTFEEEFSDERSSEEELVTLKQAQDACNIKKPVNFIDIRPPLSKTAEEALCEVNMIIQKTGDDINTRIVDSIDKKYIQDVVEKAVKLFFKKFDKEFRVRLVDTMVNEQGKIFINEPVMKMQILYAVLTANKNDPNTKSMFFVAQKIFRNALNTYLTGIASSPLKTQPLTSGIDPFMIELDKEFTAIIAIDSGSSTSELPIQIVKAIKELESVPSRKSVGGKKSKKNRSKKSKKNRSKKSRSKKSRK